VALSATGFMVHGPPATAGLVHSMLAALHVACLAALGSGLRTLASLFVSQAAQGRSFGAMQAVEKFGAIGAGLIGPALFQASIPAPTAVQPPQLALAAAGTGLQPFDGGALPFTLLAAAQLVVGALLFGALRRLTRAQMERDRASDTSSDAMDSEDASAI